MASCFDVASSGGVEDLNLRGPVREERGKENTSTRPGIRYSDLESKRPYGISLSSWIAAWLRVLRPPGEVVWKFLFFDK